MESPVVQGGLGGRETSRCLWFFLPFCVSESGVDENVGGVRLFTLANHATDQAPLHCEDQICVAPLRYLACG